MLSKLRLPLRGTAISLVMLTACGGAHVNGDAIKRDDLGPWNSPDKFGLNARQDFFRETQVDNHPGIRFNTRHGEIAIIGQPDPLAVMVTLTREF